MNFSIFFQFLNAIKTLHWTSRRHSQHVILDNIFEDFSKKIDEFIESYIGVNNPVKFDDVTVNFMMPEDDDILFIFESLFDNLSTALGKYANRPELESLVDDFNNLANKYIYLLRMAR